MVAKKKTGSAVRAEAQRLATIRREWAQAGIDFDPRTAAGKRELQVDDLGSTKRARSSAYGRLFKGRAQQTHARLAACQMFDDLWHAARTGDYPEPKFEPQVDVSTRSSKLPTRAGAKERLAALTGEVGQEMIALLWARIIENISYKAIAAESGISERKLTAQFLAATDAAARAFGLMPKAAIVSRMAASA